MVTNCHQLPQTYAIANPTQDVGKVHEKCCFCVGKVYIDENDREVSFALGLIAMSIISLGLHSWWVVAMGAIGAGLLPYCPTLCEADSAMVSAGVLMVTRCRPRSCPDCQDLAIFINV